MRIDLIKIMNNSQMLELGNFWVFNPDGLSDQIKQENHLDTAMIIYNALLEGKAIWIRGLEEYSQEFFTMSKQVGALNCHMIVAPKNAVVLGTHVDTWDILIRMLWGKRSYEIENQLMTLMWLDQGIIKKGVHHKVVNTHESISINFGMDKNVILKKPDKFLDSYITYDGLFDEHPFFKRIIDVVPTVERERILDGSSPLRTTGLAFFDSE